MSPEVIEANSKHRQAVLRRTAYLVPSALFAWSLFVLSLTGLPQSIVMVVLVGLFAIPLGIEALSALRDLPKQPVVTEGRIDRMWSKARFAFVGRVHYILVDNKLFEVGPVAGTELRLGDEVRVEHWPHSHTLVSVSRLASAPPR